MNYNNMPKTSLDRITNFLLLNALFLPNIGLNGKGGVAIFLYELFKKTQKKSYIMIADKLIDQIYAGLNKNIAPDFMSGVSGIGWCINYLVKNGFLESNIDDILDELDIQLFQLNYRQFQHNHNFNEFYWLGLYFSVRKENECLNI
jgi:hypothetical protein